MKMEPNNPTLDDLATLVELVLWRKPTLEESEAMQRARNWLTTTRMSFTVGKAYLRKEVGDPPELDYSMFDKHIVPIYLETFDPYHRLFFQDVVLEAGGKAPYTRAYTLAQTFTGVLNFALSDPDWRVCHLPILLMNDAAFVSIIAAEPETDPDVLQDQVRKIAARLDHLGTTAILEALCNGKPGD